MTDNDGDCASNRSISHIDRDVKYAHMHWYRVTCSRVWRIRLRCLYGRDEQRLALRLHPGRARHRRSRQSHYGRVSSDGKLRLDQSAKSEYPMIEFGGGRVPVGSAVFKTVRGVPQRWPLWVRLPSTPVSRPRAASPLLTLCQYGSRMSNGKGRHAATSRLNDQTLSRNSESRVNGTRLFGRQAARELGYGCRPCFSSNSAMSPWNPWRKE